VANFGFVPNGGRIYYLNRSQPPLLSEMVLALLEADEALMKGKRVVMGVALVAFIFEGIRSWCFPPLPSVRPSSF